MKATQKNHVSSVFQTVVFLGATVVLCIIFYGPFVRFAAYDNIATVTPYKPSNTTTEPIYINFTIHNFVESDIIKNDVSIDATISFGYNPQKVTREQIAQFDFDEASTEKGVPFYHTFGNLEIAFYDIHVKSKMDFNFKTYPLDDHHFWFSFKNNALPLNTYHFNVLPGSFKMGPRMTINNCVAENVRALTGYVSHLVELPAGSQELDSSRVIFAVDCNPLDMRHFLSVFLPMYLIFFLTLFSFSFAYSEHVTDVPGIAAAGIPALFAYRFVIETISPNVSYFMMSDYLFFLYLILLLLTFISVSWALNSPLWVKKTIIIGLYTFMLIGCAAIVSIFCT